MKIAITGHTRGIGLACATALESEHDIVGLSRTNEYSINKPQEIFEAAKDCDVFINNAWLSNYQVKLFELFWKEWRNEHKTIINISSQTKYEQVKARYGAYVTTKRQLDTVTYDAVLTPCTDPKSANKCRVTNIIAGWTDTDMVRMFRFKKMDPAKIGSTVKWCIDQPDDVQIFELAIWHHK